MSEDLNAPVAQSANRLRTTTTNGKRAMDVLAEKLDTKLREWKPDTAAEVKERITEIIDLADQDALDIMQARAIEEDVLSLLDEPIPR